MPTAVPVNLITGFLGVGKTTAIRHLLEHKPAEERWAVLVNEFGEIGIDGALLNEAGQSDGNQQQIFIRELPGGCMCCTMGLPMQVALNQLLARARPDRLLIEPTGLGHPRQIVHILTRPHYHSAVTVGATLTLLDPRKIADTRYTSNTFFRQQLDCADRIIANKSDLCSDDELTAMHNWLAQHYPDTPVDIVRHGALSQDSLSSGTRRTHPPATAAGGATHTHQQPETETSSVDRLPEPGWLRKDNHGDGYCSAGWLFDARHVFDYQALYNLLCGVEVDRLKAVMLTNTGNYAFNQSDGVLSSRPIETPDALQHSRLEAISGGAADWDTLEQSLLRLI